MNILSNFMKLYVVMISAALLFPLASFAQTGENVPRRAVADNKAGSDKNQKPAKFDPAAFRSSVNQALETVSKAIDSKLAGIEMLAYSKAFKVISDNPEVEKTMGIDNEWYLNISKMLADMGKYKMEVEIAKERNLAERLDAAKKNYAVLAPKFKYLIEHPVKVQKK